MFRSFTVAASVSVLMLCVTVDVPSSLQIQTPLTAEAAKQALMKMGRSGRLDRLGVPHSKDVPIQLAEKDEIAVGIFRCNLKTRVFHASVRHERQARGGADRGCSEGPRKVEWVDGRFEWAGGKWMAKVTDSGYGW
jgi:hypothetical protein